MIIRWLKLLLFVFCDSVTSQIKSHVSKSNILYSNQINTCDSIVI